VQFLLSTTRNGHLDVAAAFRAAGLGTIVDAGTAAIPKPSAPLVTPAPAAAVRRVPRPSVRRATWRHGMLVITLKKIPKGATLHAKVTFARHKPLFLTTRQLRLRARTPEPRRLVLHLTRAGVRSATVRVKVSRPRR
jgi:hypothetical protein